MADTALHWGIQKRAGKGDWCGPLGVHWIRPKVALPNGTPRWPAVFPTRAKARDQARMLTETYRPLRPNYVWQFRPVRLAITVKTV